jgi:hypothetical protein
MADPIQTDIEQRIDRAVAELERALAGTPQLRWKVVRGLVHRAVHLAAPPRAGTATAPEQIEYCSVATYLAEMIGHAHQLHHGDQPAAHRDLVH